MSKYIGAHPDEIFLGNVDVSKKKGIPDHLSSLKTVRLGEQALDVDGKAIGHDYLPMFIKRSEADLYNRIMMKLTFPNQPLW